MDSDGANHAFLTTGQAIALTPRYSPDYKSILYLSYFNGAPRIYVYDVAHNTQRLVTESRNPTFAPRWSPDGRVWQPPATFMEMAHATGRMGEVTRLVMTRAIEECRPADHRIALSINLSPRDVVRDGLAEALAEITAAAGGDPADLILDVTERALLDDPRRAARQLQSLRDKGFRIALDDFGAGWSSLSQLRDLPLDLIKLNGALAEALPGDPGARAVVGMIVALAWQLGLDCTIKGIETEAQAEAARALGITRMQGFHFGAPDTAAALMAGLQRAVA